MNTFFYFAYGSNLLHGRLRVRCPSADYKGAARASGMTLALTKRSLDGSGKATMVTGTADDCVYGALFEIDLVEQAALDRAEGKDYERVDDFQVVSDGGKALQVSTYLARQGAIDDHLRPYDWYKNLILLGARERSLPADYIAWLEGSEDWPDPVPDRPTRLEALAILEAAGWEPLKTTT